MDRRVRRTTLAIQNALLYYLQTSPLRKISVSQIIERADTSRSTFYLHYEDIYDLYDHIVNEAISDLLEQTTDNYPENTSGSYSDLATMYIDYIVQHQSLFKLITQSSDHAAVEHLKSEIINAVLRLSTENLNPENPQDYYDTVCSVNGVIGVLSDWINHGTIPKEELISVVTNIITRI